MAVNSFKITLHSLDGSGSREVIDKILSLQWCRENLVVPIGVGIDSSTGESHLLIALAHFSHLAIMGEFINQKAANAGYICQLIMKPAEELAYLLDEASIKESNHD